jgi:hypothetical protein
VLNETIVEDFDPLSIEYAKVKAVNDLLTTKFKLKEENVHKTYVELEDLKKNILENENYAKETDVFKSDKNKEIEYLRNNKRMIIKQIDDLNKLITDLLND